MWTLLGPVLAPLLTPLTSAISVAVDRLIPDRNEAQKLKDEIALEVTKADLSNLTAQLDINKIEAASPSMFVAGGRPAMIWLCVITLGFYWLGAPSLNWFAAAIGAHLPPFPNFSADAAQTALYGLLGLGGMRGVEKIFAPPANQTKTVAWKSRAA